VAALKPALRAQLVIRQQKVTLDWWIGVVYFYEDAMEILVVVHF
jgi:hypothetical protein